MIVADENEIGGKQHLFVRPLVQHSLVSLESIIEFAQVLSPPIRVGRANLALNMGERV